MPRYIIERSVPGISRDELMAAGRRSVAVLADLPGVRWIRSYVSEAEGKIYCEYDAPTLTRFSSTRVARACPSIESRPSSSRSIPTCSSKPATARGPAARQAGLQTRLVRTRVV